MGQSERISHIKRATKHKNDTPFMVRKLPKRLNKKFKVVGIILGVLGIVRKNYKNQN